MLGMGKRFIIFIVFIVLVLSLPVLFRKRTVPIVANGKVVAVGKRPFVMPWRDNEFGVYADNLKVFSLWGDMFDYPLFIHAFPDGKRFLCIDDDDTAVLVFVVDLGGRATNAVDSLEWPPDEYTRNHLAQRATNIIIETKGQVRLPSFSEVQEVSSNLANMTPRGLKAASYPCIDFGVYRGYWPKEALLNALDANRHSVWP
jgi:hypothetical protein